MFVTAEVRWFYQDECPANLHRWFGETSPGPSGGKLRVDEYLLQTNQSEDVGENARRKVQPGN
jgi:hypothetical protein